MLFGAMWRMLNLGLTYHTTTVGGGVMGGMKEEDMQSEEYAFECAIEVGIFKKDSDGDLTIEESDPAVAQTLLRNAGYDEDVVRRITKILSSPPEED
jgi:hypothetical protein